MTTNLFILRWVPPSKLASAHTQANQHKRGVQCGMQCTTTHTPFACALSRPPFFPPNYPNSAYVLCAFSVKGLHSSQGAVKLSGQRCAPLPWHSWRPSLAGRPYLWQVDRRAQTIRPQHAGKGYRHHPSATATEHQRTHTPTSISAAGHRKGGSTQSYALLLSKVK